MAEKHISDFTKSPEQIVLDLINHDNASILTLELVSLGLPNVTVDNANDRNTEIVVSSVEGGGYKGEVTVEYNRLQIQDFVPIMVEGGALSLPVGDALRFSDMIPEINLALGINLTEADYVDGDIGEWAGTPNEVKEIVIPMSADSLVYIGSLTLSLEAEDIELASVITNMILNGLNLPVAAPIEP